MSDNTTAFAAGATNYNMKDFELHVGIGGNAGSASISQLKVGTTFDSVFPSLQIAQVGTNAVLTWSDPTLHIQSATDVTSSPWTDLPNASSPYTNSLATNTLYFRFGQ